jgi:hypothetical protein
MMQNIILKADCHLAYQKFAEPEGSLPCSQKPATGPYPEPAESNSPHRRSSSVLSFHLCLGLSSGLLPSGLPIKTL